MNRLLVALMARGASRAIERLVTASPEHPRVYAACQRYVSRFRGENNDDIETNGELRLLRQELPRCEVVFDVGANIGNWAELALTINPRLRLYCFEPARATFERLAARRFPASVSCHNIGFSSAPGEQPLFVFGEASGMNTLYRRAGLEDGWNVGPPAAAETVKLETLDGFCAAHGIDKIDLLKLDVEGHELEVLKGAQGLFDRRAIRLVQFEYGGCNIDARTLLGDLFAFFLERAYTLHKIFPDRLVPFQRYDQRLEDFQYQNWVAMRAGD